MKTNEKGNTMNLDTYDIETNALDKPDIVVFDIDGTLADVAPFLHHLVSHPDSARDWNGFHEAVIDAKPKGDVLSMYALYAQRGAHIVLLTSRPVSWEQSTSEWLWKWGIQYNELIMRPTKDRRPAEEYKLDALEALMQKYNIVHVFDDHPEVIRICGELGLPRTKVPGYEEASAMMEDLSSSKEWVA